jgi:hypothetical protein
MAGNVKRFVPQSLGALESEDEVNVDLAAPDSYVLLDVPENSK